MIIDPEKLKPGNAFSMKIKVQAHPGGWITAYPDMLEGYTLVQEVSIMVKVPVDFNLYDSAVIALENQKLKILEEAKAKISNIENQISLINKNHDK